MARYRECVTVRLAFGLAVMTLGAGLVVAHPGYAAIVVVLTASLAIVCAGLEPHHSTGWMPASAARAQQAVRVADAPISTAGVELLPVLRR